MKKKKHCAWQALQTVEHEHGNDDLRISIANRMAFVKRIIIGKQMNEKKQEEEEENDERKKNEQRAWPPNWKLQFDISLVYGVCALNIANACMFNS